MARGRSGERVRAEGRGRRVGGVRPHPPARQPEVGEDLLHDPGILNRRQTDKLLEVKDGKLQSIAVAGAARPTVAAPTGRAAAVAREAP